MGRKAERGKTAATAKGGGALRSKGAVTSHAVRLPEGSDCAKTPLLVKAFAVYLSHAVCLGLSRLVATFSAERRSWFRPRGNRWHVWRASEWGVPTAASGV